MNCAPIDTEAPRFRLVVSEGFPIAPGGTTGGRVVPVLVATVLDSFYRTEHGRFASDDVWRRDVRWEHDGRWVAGALSGGGKSRLRGRESALAAAAERCAELNAWHEREGWEESLPPLGALIA